MGYKPIIYKINNENYIEIFCQFVESWYEINVVKMESINFRNLFEVDMSDELNEVLNFFFRLNHSTINGKKFYVHNCLNYIFGHVFGSQIIFFDKELDILFLFKENKRDFYYGIKRENLTESNPPLFVYYKEKGILFKLRKELNMIDFLLCHICYYAEKVGIKTFATFTHSDLEIQLKLKQVYELFDYKKQFDYYTVYEKDNVIATIPNEKDKYGNQILRINKWKQDDKEITKKITNIFDWNGWSDNHKGKGL